jgi:hypothetical protein
MKNLIFTGFLLLASCTNTPTIISFNDKFVGTYNPAAGCVGLLLKQDCSKIIGATRHIEIGAIELRIAGSVDGRVVLIMSKPTLAPDIIALKEGDAAIKNFFLKKAIKLVEAKAIYANSIIVAHHYTFDVDAYAYLKTLTVEPKIY